MARAPDNPVPGPVLDGEHEGRKQGKEWDKYLEYLSAREEEEDSPADAPDNRCRDEEPQAQPLSGWGLPTPPT